MKYIVKKPIIDKYTREQYEVGRILDISEERAKEIQAVNPSLIEAVKKKAAAPKGGNKTVSKE